MSECERFLDRLFDEDVRPALLGQAALPGDIERHAAACEACASALMDFATDLQAFPAALTEAAPARLTVATRAAFAESCPPVSVAQIDWAPATIWALAGGAAAVCLLILAGPALPWTWQMLAFATAATTALSTEITRQALESSTDLRGQISN